MVRVSFGLVVALGLAGASCNKSEAPKPGAAPGSGGKEASHAGSAKAQAALEEVIRCLDLKGLVNRFDSRREHCIRNKVPRYVVIIEGREPPAEQSAEEDLKNFEGARKKALESARWTVDWPELLRDFRGYEAQPEALTKSCVTQQMAALDPAMNTVVGGLLREYAAWKQKTDFFVAYERNNHLRVDYDFEARVGAKPRKGKKGGDGAPRNLYSGTSVPGKPELMRRLEAKGGVPEKFYCVVRDARWVASEKTATADLPGFPVSVDCETPPDVQHRISLFLQKSDPLQRGDLVSVPLANTKVPPMKAAEGKKGKKKGADAAPAVGAPVIALMQVGGGGRRRFVQPESVWVVSGATATIEEKRGACPPGDGLLEEKARLEAAGFIKASKGGGKKGGKKR